MARARALFSLGALLLALALPVDAQPPKKMSRVGYLAAVSAAADAPRLEAFRQGLRDLGYVEGQNIVIEYRHEGGGFDRLPDLAAELVRQKPDVLVAVTTNAALAVRKATTTIPIVFMGVTDPVTAGLVESLSRPGGNTTGITNIAAVLTGKRLELLKETMPALSRVAVCGIPRRRAPCRSGKTVSCGRGKLGLQLHSMEVSSVDGYEAAFKEAVEARNTALWVTLNPLANSNQKRIADLADQPSAALDLRALGLRGKRLPDGLRTRLRHGGQGRRPLRRPDPARGQAGRPSGGAADEVRAGDQPADRAEARPDHSAVGAVPGGQDHQVSEGADRRPRGFHGWFPAGRA